MRDVIAIRTNRWSLAEERLFLQLHQAFPKEDIYVVIDETKGEVETPKHVQKIGWSQDFLDKQCFLNYDHFNMGIGWLAGDYFYAAFQEQVKADYYWLIEPDVAFSFPTLADFFEPYRALEADALFGRLRQLPAQDYWHASGLLINPQADQVYGCQFPLNRLSHAAISAIKKERQRLSQMYKGANALSNTNNPLYIHFPNDEVLACTTLKRDGFDVRDLDCVFPDAFENFQFHTYFAQPSQQQLEPANNVFHPVRSIEQVADKLAGEIIKNLQKDRHLDYVSIGADNLATFANIVGQRVADYIKDVKGEDIVAVL